MQDTWQDVPCEMGVRAGSLELQTGRSLPSLSEDGWGSNLGEKQSLCRGNSKPQIRHPEAQDLVIRLENASHGQ